MPFNDIERKRIENQLTAFIEAIRPPAEIRPDLDYSYRLVDQSIELCEVRPQWDQPAIRHERPFARTTYVRAQNLWKVYWQRASRRWQNYPPCSNVSTLDDFLALVRADAHGCFFG